jgi:hypothetical protein
VAWLSRLSVVECANNRGCGVPGIFKRAQTEALLADLKRASTEAAKKERFLQYLTHSFASDPAAQALVATLALGAERAVANIERNGRMSHGRADTQTDTIIIEWEKDLARTGEHAIEQLAEYLSGNWRSGQEYRYTLITTDGIRWRTYAPDWSNLGPSLLLAPSSFQLRETRKFDLSAQTVDEFPFFLDEVIFGAAQKPATLDSIQRDFGDTSKTFINCISLLQKEFGSVDDGKSLSVAYEQWRRFLSVAYGEFDASPTMFLVHTYLSVFSKLLAYTFLARKTAAGDAEIRDVITGTAFAQMNLERFVEDDFFQWVADEPHFAKLRPVFRTISQTLAEFDFSRTNEDILKGVYQELIDLETRHALGEYYTPDWLCELIIDRSHLEKNSRILNPPAVVAHSFARL